jgi:hypothetical protein
MREHTVRKLKGCMDDVLRGMAFRGVDLAETELLDSLDNGFASVKTGVGHRPQPSTEIVQLFGLPSIPEVGLEQNRMILTK